MGQGGRTEMEYYAKAASMRAEEKEMSCEISGGTRSAALNELGLLLAQCIGGKYMGQLLVAGMGTVIGDRY